MSRPIVLAVLLAAGCTGDIQQVAGVGAVYTTRCSAEMVPEDQVYRALCTPDPCIDRFSSVAVSDVVVALDPGRRVLGYRERVCVQDLSSAAALFTSVPDPAEQASEEEEPAGTPDDDQER